MSSFKKRGAATAAPLPAGVRPSSFSSPVPLVSTGIPALDDILSGGGLSSGSLFAVYPAAGTAAQSAAQIGATSLGPSASAQTDHVARCAAEPYTDLLLGYSVAQGIASRHNGILIGEDVENFAHGLMARAGDLDDQELAKLDQAPIPTSEKASQPGPSDQLDTVADADADADADDDDSEDAKERPPNSASSGSSSAKDERAMKIAWRYERMKQFSTTVNNPAGSSSPGSSRDETPFCHTFDLSRRIYPRLVQHAREQGHLEIVSIDPTFPSSQSPRSQNSYDIAFQSIKAAAERCKAQMEAARSRSGSASSAPTPTPAPVLRISIRSLGSPSWRVLKGQRVEVEVVRFLARLKRLIRSLALADTAAPLSATTCSGATSMATTGIPTIAMLTMSPSLLSSPSVTGGINLAHRMTHVVDAAIALSAFASSPGLRAAFSAYTGAVKVLKTPCIGTLTNPSIRSSVLRGMGTGSSSSFAGGAGTTGGSSEGGAGGGENNLAFKVRRKRMVIETLHLDIEGGVAERRTKPPRNMDPSAAAARAARVGSSSGSSSLQSPHPSQAETGPSRHASSASSQLQPTAPGKPKFTSLASLRQRGLAAAATPPARPTPEVEVEVEVEVEIDTRRHHGHSH
ncbi:hypothetical protein BCV70DRAFT_182437, partial [Testicularia cyperi]